MKFFRLAAIAICLPLVATDGVAHGLDVQADWAAGVTETDKSAAVYLKIVNDAFHPEYLYGAATPVAARVELHLTAPSGKMVRLDRLEIPYDDSVDMRKSGHHLMLIGLKRRLRPGEKIPLELTFSDNQIHSIVFEAPGRK